MNRDRVLQSSRYTVWMIRDTMKGKWVRLRGPMTENDCVKYADRNPDRFKVYEVNVSERYSLVEKYNF